MPETRFQIQLPDGTQQTCYSPSSVVKDYFTPGTEYELEDFVQLSRTALHKASDRVEAKYGLPCSRAISQLQQIEAISEQYRQWSAPKVQFLKFLEFDQ